ncbi:MAG: hypothetical protein GOV00_01680 [Candidatus Altiarchaeota archaeon]|nr:hypothetical protein [Candidatus Altiarchaeota archaeon]
MEIQVTWASESGPTEISAFDKALHSAGISDFNLIPLSSVVPTGSKIVFKKPAKDDNKIGHRLYVVLSCRFATVVGEEAWAGLGWAQREDGSGIFVEPNASTEKDLRAKINGSIESMLQYRTGKFSSIGTKIVGADCVDDYSVCALVCAVFKSEKW